MHAIDGVRKCRVNQMRLCVTSEPEERKCNRMRTALNAQLLEPKMSCRKAPSAFHCMKLIANNDADAVVLDAGDIYRYKRFKFCFLSQAISMKHNDLVFIFSNCSLLHF